MNRFAFSALCVAVLTAMSACGEAPQGDAPASPNLQQISFTGVVEPASGRFQLITAPQAAIGVIPEDGNGNPATATPGTAQVFGATVNFALSGGPGYPAGCTGPQAMYADVGVLSGFTEQLRNVYARMTQVSNGPTFCNSALPGAIAPPAGSYVGLYFYQPLNAGTAPSAISRSVQWALNLPDNSTFSFKGDLWAEIIPQLPTVNRPTAPDGGNVSVGNGTSGSVLFRWVNDPRANGSNSGENYAVARPTVRGAMLTILQCGPATGAYDPTSCVTTVLPATQYTTRHTHTLLKGYWFQWTLQTVFSLPGQGAATTTGTLIFTRTFRTVT